MSESIFEKGLKLDVTKHIEKKGKFSYLSWAWAVQELRKLDSKATWEVLKFKDGDMISPCMKTSFGCFVEVVVTLSDSTSSQQIHPVLDNSNKTLTSPNAFQINTSIQRCLVKAIALASGIGLHIYAGEDLPPGEEKEKKNWLKEIKAAKQEFELQDIFKEAWENTKGKERDDIKAAYDKRKVEITELGGNSQAQRGE